MMENFPKNPALIHKIQDALLALNGADILMRGIIGAAIIAYAKTAPKACISILNTEAKIDREIVVSIIGEKTMLMIDEYFDAQTETIDDLKDVNI